MVKISELNFLTNRFKRLDPHFILIKLNISARKDQLVQHILKEDFFVLYGM